MKFQSIFIVLSLLLCTLLVSEPLTEAQDQYLSETCGRNLADWYWIPEHSRPDQKEVYSAAIQISSRHFLTSANALFYPTMAWRSTRKNLTGDCEPGSLNYKIPDNELQFLKLKRAKCFKDPSFCYLDRQIKSAYLLKMCEPSTKNKFLENFTPLLIEISGNIGSSFPCLPHKDIDFKKGEDVVMIDTGSDGTELNLQISTEYMDVITTTKFEYNRNQQIGRPLIKTYGDVKTIIGTSVYASSKFLNLKWFRTDLCSLAGICKTKEPIINSLPITTTVSTIIKPVANAPVAPTVPTAPPGTKKGPSSSSMAPSPSLDPNPQFDFELPTDPNENEDYFFDKRYFKDVEEPYGVELGNSGGYCNMWILIMVGLVFWWNK